MPHRPFALPTIQWRSHLSWPVLGIFLVGAWLGKKGDFTSEASPLCLGRAHKSLRMVGHSPRKGGRVRLIYLTINALHAVLGQKMRRERVFLLACGLGGTSKFFFTRYSFFGSRAWQSTSSPLRTCQQRWHSHLSWPVLGIFLVGAWLGKKGDFTSEASPLCPGRAHKSLRTVGHSPP